MLSTMDGELCQPDEIKHINMVLRPIYVGWHKIFHGNMVLLWQKFDNIAENTWNNYNLTLHVHSDLKLLDSKFNHW
jgi:hypothetical protein